MKLIIKKGREFGINDVPLLAHTRDLLTTDGHVPINRDYFKDDLDPDREYVALSTDVYRSLSQRDQERIWQICSDMNLTGNESRNDLEAALARQNAIAVDIVVNKVANLYNKPRDEELEAELKEQVKKVGAEVENDYMSPSLDRLLDNENVCVHVTSLTHPGFSNLPALTPELAQQVSKVKVPFYIVLDVSGSMGDEERYLHAQELAKQIHHYIRTNRLSDDVKLFIYSGSVQEIPTSAHKLISPQDSTATGSALEHVGRKIALEHPDQEVYIALITDGEPTYAGGILDPQAYAEKMAGQLPKKSKLIQFAFAPVDPSDRSAFEAYLERIHNVTENAPYGQTIVLVRERENLLGWLAVGGHQRIKHLCWREYGNDSGKNLTDIVES